jgi:phospholipase C
VTRHPPHSWNAVHHQWNGGAMDGFYKSSAASIGDGDAAIGYYTEQQLPFYYSLLEDSALVASFFCPLLGPTWPNRFWGYGVFDYPTIVDLLDAAGVTWKVCNLSWDSVPFGNTDNVFVFWKRYVHDMRTLGSKGSFINDARRGRLPQVSWLIPSFARGWDEHPPADVSVGLPTLASANHMFDTSTPTGCNYQTGDAPAPPRDAREDIGDLMDCFDF